MRAVLAVAVLALLFSFVNAQLQICDNKKAPGAPWNTLLTQNVYDAASKTASKWKTDSVCSVILAT